MANTKKNYNLAGHMATARLLMDLHTTFQTALEADDVAMPECAIRCSNKKEAVQTRNDLNMHRAAHREQYAGQTREGPWGNQIDVAREYDYMIFRAREIKSVWCMHAELRDARVASKNLKVELLA